VHVQCTLYSTKNGHAVIRLGYDIIIEHAVCHNDVVGFNSSGLRNILNEIHVQQPATVPWRGIGMFSY
jgi:hypothetical protein